MQDNDNSEVLVMFVDVAGSTQLFEQLGETAGHTRISSCLAHLGALVDRFGGKIIKHIGDEVLCVFADLVCGLQAAVAAQVEMSTSTSLSSLPVKIGCHYGPVLFKQGDVFGDTVNVAAHLATLAQAKQILTTDTCLKFYESQYDPRTALIMTELFEISDKIPNRFLTRFKPKGKQYQVSVQSIIWEGYLAEASTDITFIQSLEAHHIEQNSKHLVLTIAGVEYFIDAEHNQLTIGRAPEADIYLNDGNVSRLHGLFKLDAGQFMYQDRSSNGSYIAHEMGKPQFVHRQTVVLSASGQISCGQSFEENLSKSIIEYEISEASELKKNHLAAQAQDFRGQSRKDHTRPHH